MKILLIGKNDGGTMSHTVRCLNDRGHKAVGMTFFYSKIVNYKGLLVFQKRQALKYYYKFLLECLRADVVHLLSLQVPGIVAFLKLIRKPFVIEWTGSDIRNPELMPPGYKTDYKESKKISHKNQKPFARVINIVSSAILGSHVINPIVEYIPHRIYLPDYPYSPTLHEPLRLAHAPSNRSAKGTDKILEAVKDLPVEFDLIEGVSNEECIERLKDCDIFLDQFVWGEHGMASMEAIALGKTALCWISHDKYSPCVNCTTESIKDNLKIIPRRLMLEYHLRDTMKSLLLVYGLAIDKYKMEMKIRYAVNPELAFTDNYSSPS